MVYVSKFPPVPQLPPFNAYQFIFNRPGAPEIPDDIVLAIDAMTGRKRTRGQHIELVQHLAAALVADLKSGGLALSSQKGHMVGVYSDNSMDFLVIVHALLLSGVPSALLSSHSTPFELAHSLKRAKVTHLFAQPSFIAQALKVGKQKDVGLPSDRIFALGGEALGRKSMLELAEWAKKKSFDRVDPEPVEKDTLAYLVFSSGTSGLPKAVMISHMNVNYSLAQHGITMMEAMKITGPPPLKEGENPKILAFLPMYHSFGLHAYVFRSMLAPTTLIIMPRWNLDLAIKCIPKYKINIIAAVPSIVYSLAHSPKFMDPKLDTSSVLSLGSSAAYLPSSLRDKFMAKFQNVERFATGYGLSEVTIASLFHALPGMLPEANLVVSDNALGILHPGHQARIVIEEEGKFKDAAVGETGELWLKGGNIAMGYYGDEKATRETFLEDGWLRTGDRFYADKNENFFFQDRAKDTLKVSGMQVSPQEIEEFIQTHPTTGSLVADACVAGVITSKFSRTEDEKVPRAWLVLSPEGKKAGKKEVEKTVIKTVEEGLSKYKWLRGGVEFIETIPKNPTGKVLKRQLVADYDKQHPVKTKARL